VTRNLLANFSGRLFTGVLTLALVPAYLGFLGMEAYGLVAFFATLQVVVAALDLGLSTTLNREVARLSALEGSAREARDLVRTAEVGYWLVAALVAAAAWPVSSVLASHWFRSVALSPELVRRATLLMLVAAAIQFPFAASSGGLMGLQRQVLLNGILIGGAALRGGGAVFILWLVSPTVDAFLSWHIAAGGIQTIVGAVALWRRLPAAEGRDRFRPGLWRARSRFASGVGLVSLLGLVLSHTDKLILSRVLRLDQFGSYALAGLAASSLYIVITPVFSAVFPRFSQLATAGDQGLVRRLYHETSQAMSVLVIPPALVLALFPREAMLLWTREPETAAQTAPVVRLLVSGVAIHGLVHVPYALQLAHGWTRLALRLNITAILVLIPLLVVLTRYRGAQGAALVWLALNVGYLVFMVQIMHRKLLPGEQWEWYAIDVGLPLLAAAAAAGAVRLISLELETVSGPVAGLLAAAGASFAAAAMAARTVRRRFLGRAKKAP
jgi:O-antigen/teichoic acid export membrane protein